MLWWTSIRKRAKRWIKAERYTFTENRQKDRIERIVLKLYELLKGCTYRSLQGKENLEIRSIAYHSEKAEKGSVFVCIRGADADGHDFVQDAVKRGAVAVICEKPVFMPEGVTVILTEDSRRTMARMAAAFYGDPAEKLTLIGITGTNGKTTTAGMLKAALERAGIRTGLIGTICVDTGDEKTESLNTTPESIEIHKLLRKMTDCGCSAAVMEVSSQALMQGRTEGLLFDYAVFTNLESDHIGPREHRNFEEYVYWKSRLFTQCRKAVVNGDDPHLKRILQDCSCPVVTYGFGRQNLIRGENFECIRMPEKLGVEFQIKGDYNINLVVGMTGKFSCSNAMAAAAVYRELCDDKRAFSEALREIRIPGRQEMFRNGGSLIMVDYAHNGRSVSELLNALSAYHPRKLLCLFGCGGQRSPHRRKDMARAAAELADFSIVTADNPRNEPLEQILSDIAEVLTAEGCSYAMIPDRTQAICFGTELCKEGDILAVLGRGHETCQIIGDGIKYADDREDVRQAIEKVKNERNYTGRN